MQYLQNVSDAKLLFDIFKDDNVNISSSVIRKFCKDHSSNITVVKDSKEYILLQGLLLLETTQQHWNIFSYALRIVDKSTVKNQNSAYWTYDLFSLLSRCNKKQIVVCDHEFSCMEVYAITETAAVDLFLQNASCSILDVYKNVFCLLLFTKEDETFIHSKTDMSF